MTEKLLITGCHRAGTTLLSSMIGLHKVVAIVNEDYFDSFKHILSKKYVGVKAVIPSIHLSKKRNLLYTMIFRKTLFIRNLFKLPHAMTFLPYCINDFDKVIIIHRDNESNIQSIMKRTGVKRKYAKRDVDIATAVKFVVEDRPNVMTISLQELTIGTPFTLRRICVFLGLEYDEIMIEGYKHTPCYSNDSVVIKSWY